ncbi:LexA family protein [Reyranella sp.]|uniref:LexA family protein n=1 Tax=Reyranella sp. TaxID=1929291 RepID=UPI003D0E0791
MTRQQSRLLQFIAEYQRAHGGEVSPSLDEMGRALGLKSKAGVHRLLVRLEDAGRIARDPRRARSVRLVDPTVTVAEFRAIVLRLAEREGLAGTVGLLQSLADQLAARVVRAA